MKESAGQFAFDYTMHDGAAPISIQHHFVNDLNLPVGIQTWDLPPGGTEGMHRHGDDQPLQEFYLVISGRALMHLGGEILELGPGDAALAPAGVDHDLVNVGDAPLRILTVWGAPGAGDFTGFGSVELARATWTALTATGEG